MCSRSLVVNPIDNLALPVFRRYSAKLSRALSSCPDEVAAELCAEDLITQHDKSHAVETQGITPFRKAEILMDAVARKIETENSAVPLRKFCHLLQRGYGIDSIVVRMKSGEWEQRVPITI